MSNADLPSIELATIVLDCTDIHALSDFYIRLLGWEKDFADGDNWLCIRSATGGIRLGFQYNEDYVPPAWPEEPDRQQQMIHIDFAVPGKEGLERAVQHALSCGAVKAPTQYSEDWCVMLDPAEHPFCLVAW